MSDENEIEITLKDVEFIMGDNFKHFPELERNAFCPRCGGSLGNNVTEIIDYKIFLNELNDIILEGKCKKCGEPVSRYIETGEDEEANERAESIKKNKLN